MIVDLTREEVRTCSQLAVDRWVIKFGSTDRPNYAKGKANGQLEHELLATVRANICEWAVAKALNLSWNVPVYPNALHNQRAKIADVGVNGEVRSIRTAGAIPFWEKDKGKVIYGVKVLNTETYMQVEIYGAFCADQFMTDEFRDESIGGWRMPIPVLTQLGLTAISATTSQCLCALGEHRCDV